jgi:transcriptional regulator with XRE-family HTH domain
MVDRIQEILDRYELTAARLADQLDVPRSTISHILSERNKPSLDFIQKVLANFPEINASWLVKGEGKIFDDNSNLFYSNKLENEKKEVLKKDEITSNPFLDEIISHEPGKENLHQNLREVKADEELRKTIDNDYVNNQKNTPQKRGKRIVRLITIYSDNTFSDFYPSTGE